MKIQIKNILWEYAFLVVGLAYFFGLFVDLTGDSGLYAAISRQMVESGDWFNLKINCEPYDQKPHLFFWLAGLGIQLFGNTNFAFKLFPFLYGLIGIYFTYRLGKQLFSAKAGKLAALITGTSQIFFLYFFDIHTDIILQTGVTLALWQLAAWLKFKKPVNFIFGFFGIGLAMLSKGPVGAVIPFFAVLLYLLLKKDFRQLFHLRWLLGILIVLAVISPTLIHLYKSFGFEGLTFYFVTNNFGRISGEYAGSSSDPFFYIYNMIWAFLPWTVFIFTVLFLEIKSWFLKKGLDIWGVYLLGSTLLFILILSVAKGKAPNYFLIAVPPISVITARWLTRYNELPSKTKINLIRAQAVLISLLAVLLLTAGIVFSEGKLWLLITFIVLSCSLVSIFFRFNINELKRVIFASVIVASTSNLFLNIVVIPGLFKYQGARQVLEIYEENRGSGDQLFNFELEEYELFFMAKDSVGHIKNWDLLYEVMKKPGSWVYTNQAKYNDIVQMNYKLDTVFQIRQKGMNKVSWKFLNPSTRNGSLDTNYLIRTTKVENGKKPGD